MNISYPKKLFEPGVCRKPSPKGKTDLNFIYYLLKVKMFDSILQTNHQEVQLLNISKRRDILSLVVKIPSP